MTHEEREKTLRQLVEYAEDISEEYGMTIVLTVCVEEKVANNAVVQSTSHFVRGNETSLKRMIAFVLKQSDDFKKLIVESLFHSLKMSLEEFTIDERTKERH